MPLNLVHDKDGLPRVILSEPTGSTAEVYFFIYLILSALIFFLPDLLIWSEIGSGIFFPLLLGYFCLIMVFDFPEEMFWVDVVRIVWVI